MLTGVAINGSVCLPVMSDGWEPSPLPGPLRTNLMNCFPTKRVTQHSFVISMNFQKPAKWTVFTAPDHGSKWDSVTDQGLGS